jgi:hypothetical protein
MTRLHRPRGSEEQRATSLELFYDLVFVYAINQGWRGSDAVSDRQSARRPQTERSSTEITVRDPDAAAR